MHYENMKTNLCVCKIKNIIQFTTFKNINFMSILQGIWRWMYNDTGPQIYEVKIAFYNSQNPGSSKELSSLYLVRKSSRKVKNLKWKSYFKPFCLRIVCKTGTYVSANVEDLNLRGNTVNPPKNRCKKNPDPIYLIPKHFSSNMLNTQL